MADQSRLIIHFALMAPLAVLSTLAVALRFYTRLYITKLRLAADDYLIFVAMFLSNASYIVVAVADIAFDEGQALGNSRSEISKKVGMRKIHWIVTQIYPIMSFSLKTSILLLYRRIFFVVPTFTRVCNVLIIIITAIHLAGFTSGIFLCMPITYFWRQVLPPGYPGAPTHRGRCQNYQVAWLILGSFNVLTDLIAVVLPLPVLGRLKITATRRAFLVFIFALSSVPCIASLLRIRPLARIPGGNNDPLFSQHVWELQLYCGIEISVGITCACLPTLTPLAIRLFPNIMGSSQGGIGSETFDRAAGAAPGGCAWRRLKCRKASDDVAINPVTTIGGTSAKLPGFGSGRKGSGTYTSVTTITTGDKSMESKTTATVVGPLDGDELRDQVPLSPKDKGNDIIKPKVTSPAVGKETHSKKKNALGLRLLLDKSWMASMATALTPQQHQRRRQQQEEQSSKNETDKWTLSTLPLPSPSFSLNVMLSPKATAATTTQAVWAARMSEVMAAPLLPAQSQNENARTPSDEKDGVATAQAEAEDDSEDRARQRTRRPASSQRRRSSRSLDWQAASGIRNSTRERVNETQPADPNSAVWQWPRRGSSRAQGASGFVASPHAQWPSPSQPHPHPLYSNPQNSPPPQLQAQPQPASPTHSLPSPSIYSRASVATAFTVPYRRPSVADTQDHAYHQHHRRPSVASSFADHHRRPSAVAVAAAADAYATIIEDDGVSEDSDEGHRHEPPLDEGQAQAQAQAQTQGEERGQGQGRGVHVQSQWWMQLRKTSNTTDVTDVTLAEEVEEDERASWRGSVVSGAGAGGSGLRRRPMSWTSDWRRV